VLFFQAFLVAGRPFGYAFQIVIQDLDPAIKQGSNREKAFLLSIYKVLGRSAREKSEELIGGRVPPITHLIGELGFLFSSFFRHI
jgi:hypothetical protein